MHRTPWLWHTVSDVATSGFSCSEACEILVPRPGIEPACPALQGRFFTTGPAGSSPGAVMHVPRWAGGGGGGGGGGGVSLFPWLDVGTREGRNATLEPPAVCFAVWPLRFPFHTERCEPCSHTAPSHIFNYRLNQLSCQWTSWKLSIEYVLLLENRIRMWNCLSPCPTQSLNTEQGEREGTD